MDRIQRPGPPQAIGASELRIDHIDLWIASANARVAAEEAAEEKRRAGAQSREERVLVLSRINDKFKDL